MEISIPEYTKFKPDIFDTRFVKIGYIGKKDLRLYSPF
jgi:hypothetical protein